MAGGVFAPGHLGELTASRRSRWSTRYWPTAGRRSSGRRKLPARVALYLVLAAAPFEACGHPAVRRTLTSALAGCRRCAGHACGVAAGLHETGTGALRALFDLLRGSAAAPRTSGPWWRGPLGCAIDGTRLDVRDDPATRARLGKGSNQYTAAFGYLQVRLAALVACGTRAIIDAVFGLAVAGEPASATLPLASCART